MSSKKTYGVLVVDDSEDDRFFLKKALARGHRFHVLAELENGEEAAEYLAGRGKFHRREAPPLPDLLILDLKMPRMNGYELLQWLQSHPVPHMTVVVLSGSNLEGDVEMSMKLGAHGFWTKTSIAEHQWPPLHDIEALMDKREKEKPRDD